jgi:hypothetical protein
MTHACAELVYRIHRAEDIELTVHCCTFPSHNILTVSVSQALTILAIVKYLLEIYMMRRKNSLHGRAYARLSPRNQRTLVNHHVSLAIKVCLFCFGM